MARKADTPCAKCGRLLWVGRGSLPNPVCRPCRRTTLSYQLRLNGQAREIKCQTCGSRFRSSQPNAKFCGVRCRDRAKRLRHNKPPHYKGSYPSDARKIRAAANANPSTKCWRCGRTLAEHPPHKTGSPPRWTAGHVIDGDPTSPLLPEASTCNYTAGAKLRHRKRSTLAW